MGKSSSKKIKEPLNNKNRRIINGLEIFIIAALAAVIFYPPYLQGLFFEKHILPTGIFVFSLFIIFCIYKWTKKDFTMFKTPIDYISLAFVVVYFISIFVAVHTRSAIIELLKYCLYFAVFYMITDVAESKKTKLIFLWTITASAVGVSIIGLDSAIGGNFVRILNKLFNSLGVQGDMFFGLFVSNRINSTIQYPNALASYIMAIFFVVIGLILSSEKLWVKIIGGTCAYILFLTFMLTESRGAQILFPVILIFFMIVSPKGNRIKCAVHTVLLTIPAIIVSFLVLPYLSGTSFSKRAFGYMIAGMIASIALSFIVQFIGDLLQKINWMVYTVLALILVAVLFIGGNKIIHDSVPIELSHKIDVGDDSRLVMRDIALTPNKSYILCYTADATAIEKKPYIYSVEISGKSIQNIQFGGRTQLVFQTTKDVSSEEKRIEFSVPEDSKLVNVTFLNYYAGTGVILDNVKILDAQTGETIKKIVLKNKYNMENITIRFDNILYDKSFIARLIFYKDGLDILKNLSIFGGGGGAWEYLYRQFQSHNYSSTQAHNYPLQLGIETGFLGILLLIFLCIFLLYIYNKYYRKNNQNNNSKLINGEEQGAFLVASVISTITALLMHSTLDFDFSESAILLLFWELIAIFCGEVRSSLTFSEMVPFYHKKGLVTERQVGSHRFRVTGIAVSALVSAVLLIFAVNFVRGATYAHKAYVSLRDNKVEEAISNISKAISADKYNEKYVIGYNPIPTRADIKTGLADVLLMKQELLEQREQAGEKITQTEAAVFQRQLAVLSSQMQRIEKSTSNNLSLTNNLASYYLSTGRIDQGIEYLNQGIKLFSLEPTIWYSKVNIYYQIMSRCYNNEDYENAEKYLSAALDVITEASKANERNMNPFILGEDAVEQLQYMQFMKDHWNQEKMTKVNDIIHYTIPHMDVNLDGIPDQWKTDDSEQITMNISDQAFSIHTQGSSYVYTQYPLKLEKGKTYTFEIRLDRSVESVMYEIAGVVKKTNFTILDDNRYKGEFRVDNEPSVYGNPLWIYFDSDCMVKSVILVEKDK